MKHLLKFLFEEYKTKSGKEITFEVIEDSEGDENRGWIVHKIDAYVDGENVGYLKISYIPQKRFQQHFKNIFVYLGRIEGAGWARDLVDDTQDERLKKLSFAFDSWPGLRNEEIEKMSKQEKDRLEKKYIQIAKRKHNKNFEIFKDFHLDKPIVDYIRVFEDYKRNRIAAALYEFGAKWLAKKGMKLYASGIQSDEAKAAWQWLKNNKGANIGQETNSTGKTRTFLSYL